MGLIWRPLAPRPRRTPFSQGGGGERRLRIPPGIGDFSPCLGKSWSSRFELVLPSAGLAFSECGGPVPPAPPRTVATPRYQPLPGSSKRKVAVAFNSVLSCRCFDGQKMRKYSFAAICFVVIISYSSLAVLIATHRPPGLCSATSLFPPSARNKPIRNLSLSVVVCQVNEKLMGSGVKSLA